MPTAANVTKYNAGGSGDNVIKDGYIKTVEKLWMDSYTMDFVTTRTTIDIAVLPAGKKVTGIDIFIETAASQTSGSIAIGFSTDSAIDSFLAASVVCHNATRTTISLPLTAGVGVGAATATGEISGKIAGFQKVTAGTQTTVSIRLDAWTMSSGTIKSIVRYT
jgi:hypothetical protein